MCGILGVVSKNKAKEIPLNIATTIIRHRGPDDCGYMSWSQGQKPRYFADTDTISESRDTFDLEDYSDHAFDVGFGHRRLSILDLSSAGHQPMVFGHLLITYNGEVYNYIEIREELKILGRKFKTQTDTEVILQAWDEWGEKALSKFNGMFSFLILDTKAVQVFVVRDRFGVKPLYFTETENYFAFASEVKQLRVLPDYTFELNRQIAYDYLRYGYLDHTSDSFEKGISLIEPSYVYTLDINTKKLSKKQWYTLNPKAEALSFNQAKVKFTSLLKDAVKLRLRSDVPVGSALSGGMDSSAVVCLMRDILDERGEEHIKLETVTSCNEDLRFDETKYAEIINQHTRSNSHKIYPSFETLKKELKEIIWHLDYPFGSSSQFAQWSVFKKSAEAGLTVMIDGQGADEQLAGYGGNDLALYSGLLKKGKLSVLKEESTSYKQRFGQLPKGFLLGAFQALLPNGLQQVFPDKYRPKVKEKPSWLNHEAVEEFAWEADTLQENLINQIQISPLPALLRYEDRNSMAFSVESRTPFMDYRLMEFSLGLPEEYIYRQGERKYILKKSMETIVPEAVLDRKDKMGFLSGEEKWLKEEGKEWFYNIILSPLPQPYEDIFDTKELEKMVRSMQAGESVFGYEPWRVLNFKLWLNIVLEQKSDFKD